MLLHCLTLCFIVLCSTLAADLHMACAEEAAPAADPGLGRDPYEEEAQVSGPAGKRHIIASAVIYDGHNKRLLTLQVLDLMLIAHKHNRRIRPPPFVERLAYLLVDSSWENPMEGKLLGLAYGQRPPNEFATIIGDIVCDPQYNSAYLFVHRDDGCFGRLGVSVWKTDLRQSTAIPQFDPAQAAEWPAPTMTSIGKLSLCADGSRISLTACYDNDRLLVHAVAEKSPAERDKRILLALDLKTLKWNRLDVEMKELEDQALLRF